MGISDQESLVDSLNFSPYIYVLQRFLLSANPPLTISIEGEWGAGKSSFMSQLRARLQADGYATVYFNPWRYRTSESVWAAFLLTFIDQLKGNLTRRERFHVQRRLLQEHIQERRDELIRYSLAILSLYLLIVALIHVFGTQAQTIASALGITAVSGVGLVLWIREKVVRRMENEIQSSLTTQKYEDRVAFIEEFQEDFSQWLDAYLSADEFSSSRRVFVFIDDLDRCEVSSVADLVESIHLMLANDSRLVFLLGMDRELVAGALAAKHGDILQYLTPDTEHDYGDRYIQKFVQVPFVIPRVPLKNIDKFVSNLMTTEALTDREESVSASDDYSEVPDYPAEWSDALVREMTKLAAPVLNYNPRQLKRFVNLYSLSVLLSEATKSFHYAESFRAETGGSRFRELAQARAREAGGTAELVAVKQPIAISGQLNPRRKQRQIEPTLYQIGKFVIITLRWPRLLQELRDNPKLLTDLTLIGLRRHYWPQYSDELERRLRDEDSSTVSASWKQRFSKFMPESDDEADSHIPDISAYDETILEQGLAELRPAEGRAWLSKLLQAEQVEPLLDLLLAGLYEQETGDGESAPHEPASQADEFENLLDREQAIFNEQVKQLRRGTDLIEDDIDPSDYAWFFTAIGPVRIEDATGANSVYSLANQKTVRTLLEIAPSISSRGEYQYRQLFEYRQAIERNPNASWIRVDLANLLRDLGHLEEAEGSYQEALNVDETDVDAHFAYGKFLIEEGRFEEAEEAYSNGLSFSRPNGDQYSVVHALSNLGYIAHTLGALDEAKEHYNQGLEVARKISDLSSEVYCLLGLGNIAHTLGALDKAKEHYNQGLEVARKISDLSSEAYCLLGLGSIAASKNKVSKAQEHFDDSLRVAKEAKDKSIEAATLFNLGGVALSRSDLPKAEQHFNACLNMSELISDQFNEATSHYGLGQVAFLQGKMTTAAAHFEKSLELYRELNLPPNIAEGLYAVGIIALNQGKLDDAERSLNESLEISYRVGLGITEAFGLTGLGWVAFFRGRMNDAENYFKESLAISREVQLISQIADNLEGLATVALERGELRNAEESVEEMLEISTNPLYEAAGLQMLGNIARDRGDLVTAEECFPQSLNIWRDIGNRRGKANSLTGLGDVAREQNKLDRAEVYYNESRETFKTINFPQGESTAVHGLGRVSLARGDYQEAIHYLMEAVEIRREIGALQSVLDMIDDLLVAYEAIGDDEAAIEWCRVGLDVADQTSADERSRQFRTRLDRLTDGSDDSTEGNQSG